MADVDQIRNNLFLGDWRPAANHSWLIANGITAILNVAKDVTDPDCGIARYKQGLADGSKSSAGDVSMAVLELNELLDEGEIVLLHDCSGQSRAPYIAAKVLSVRESKTYDQIYTELRGLHPETRFPETLRPIIET